MSSAYFIQNLFFRNSFRNAVRVSNSLDPDQARHFVGPDLGPNCLQRLSADNTRRYGMLKLLTGMRTVSHSLTGKYVG